MQLARFISYVFHPVLIPIVSALLYFISIPNHIPKEFAYRVLGIIFISTYFIPIGMLYFLKRVKLIESFHLSSINERKFPILFFTILALLLGRLLLQTKAIDLLAFSFFGCSVALIIVYLLFFRNIKTSLHTLGISGLIGFISVLSYTYKQNFILIIILLVLLFGIIATARLKLNAHTVKEVFMGFGVGFFSQLITYAFYVFYFLKV